MNSLFINFNELTSIKYFPYYLNISDKRLVSKIYKELLKFKNKKTTQLRGKTIWTNTSPTKMYRWQVSIWKDAPHHMSSGKGKVKQQWDSTAHLLEWPTSRTLTAPNVGLGWQGCGATGTLIHRWWECKMVQPLWKTVYSFLQKSTHSYHMIQQLCSLVFTQTCWEPMSTQKLALKCL